MKSPKSKEIKSLDLIAARFRVLGDPLRLRLLHLLSAGECSVGTLVRASGTSQANVSKHLQIMLRAGLVARRKEGLSVFYRIADESVFQLCDVVCGRLSEQFRADLSAVARLRHRSRSA